VEEYCLTTGCFWTHCRNLFSHTHPQMVAVVSVYCTFVHIHQILVLGSINCSIKALACRVFDTPFCCHFLCKSTDLKREIVTRWPFTKCEKLFQVGCRPCASCNYLFVLNSDCTVIDISLDCSRKIFRTCCYNVNHNIIPSVVTCKL
jgi:hypothetical protein